MHIHVIDKSLFWRKNVQTQFLHFRQSGLWLCVLHTCNKRKGAPLAGAWIRLGPLGVTTLSARDVFSILWAAFTRRVNFAPKCDPGDQLPLTPLLLEYAFVCRSVWSRRYYVQQCVEFSTSTDIYLMSFEDYVSKTKAVTYFPIV